MSSEQSSGVAPMSGEEPVILPASYVQELLWLMDRASPMSSAYNVPRTRRLIGAIDADALRRAFDAVVARHEILRTTYAFHEDQPVQVIHAPRPVPFVQADLRATPEPARTREAERLVLESARRPFDLTSDILMRVLLVRMEEREYILHFDSHHIAFDGWSRDVLFRELAAMYTEFAGGAKAALPELPIQYADYAIWERENLTGEKLDRLLGFWRKQIGDASFVLELPTDFPRPAVPGFGGVTERILLPSSFVEQVKQLGREHDATLYMTLLAAYATVLHRYTGQDDVLVGSPSAGRSRSETEGLIGYFANTVVQRARCANDPTFAQLLDQIRESALGAYDHQEIPFEKLVLELQGGQQLSHSPLFQVVFTMLGGTGTGTAGKFADLDMLPFGVEDGSTKFDLTLFMADHPDGLALTLRARSDLYAAETVRRMLGHIETVLRGAVANPSRRLSELPLLPDAEVQAVAAWNDTAVSLGEPTTIPALFAAQAARVPTRVAVVSGGRSLTYAELDARSNQLAHRLRGLGVRKDATVVVVLDRSVELVVAMLAVLKTGGAYVPVLPDTPAPRVARQVEESGAAVVITVNATRDRIPASTTVVSLDGDADTIAAQPSTMVDDGAMPDGLAYVLYTSGSTGVPKGVAVTHRNIVHYTRAVSRVLASTPTSVPGDGLGALDGWQFAMVSSVGADLGNTSLFPSLCAGGTLHLLPSSITTDPARFVAYAEANPIDVMKITPNHLRALTAGLGASELARVLPRQWIVLGGEAFPWDFAERLLGASRCRVLNHYGPTETTVGVSTFEVTAESMRTARDAGAQTVPVGTPLANTQLHVLDAHRNVVPVGIPGELYISGDGVTRGYLHRDELTAERFVTLDKAGRAYRSGDRVRRLPSGAVEFLGRGDDQVKVRGYRVELSEIEHALREHPMVSQAVVLLRGADAAEAKLTAYTVVSAGSGYATAHVERPTPENLAAWVAARLPEYMVPSAVVILDALPLTATGKVDRAALPDPSDNAETAGGEFVAPRTPTEEAIAEIWRDVLKKDQVGITDNFIALGGHSLLAIRVLGKLSRRFGIRLPLRTLFDAPTVEQLSELVDLETKLAALEGMSDEDAAALLQSKSEQEPAR